eukprot:Blabericola_migrator_1__5901@NODE_2988_length_2139_cov_150_775579_g1869_i0_p1_GENE_NODE_2988_length_2139_cov_150_775579_g1869_i0NODE_2988_length_2139_cov_150_775579_g1869_i0_p1_ORF_typecomplete_len285_score37_29_NODE_2988_length_2139_cov_150_775579_g1869_i07581612
MSARHLQKPKQINLKDGTFGTALLVTLAFDQPATTSALSSESYVPSTSYTDSPTAPTAETDATMAKSFDLLDSLEIFLESEIPTTPQAQQQWISLRISLMLQIIQAHCVDQDGIPVMKKTLGELYTANELIKCKDVDLREKSPHLFTDGKKVLVDTVDQLMAALDERDKLEWILYEKEHGIGETLPEPHGNLHKYFHAAQWLFARASPEFFADHRKNFAGLSRLLMFWAREQIEKTAMTSMPSAWSLIADVSESGDLPVDAFEAFKKIDTFLVDRHFVVAAVVR